MTTNDENRMMARIKQAVPRINADSEPRRDLWPAVLKRIGDEHEAMSPKRSPWVWLDAALLAGLAILGVSFPATIPLLLYYL